MKNNCHVENERLNNLIGKTQRFFASHCSALNDGKRAFTLAEVLITLTIIGVIAALTIPNLIQKWQDQQTISGVKEAYSILDNAFKMAIREKGSVNEWNWPGGLMENGDFLAETLKQYLHVNKFCKRSGETANGGYCLLSILKLKYDNPWYGRDFKYLNGKADAYDGTNGGGFQLTNGMVMLFDGPRSWTDADEFMGNIYVDINGKKGPNRLGYDCFYFSYGFKGLIMNIKTRTGTSGTFYSDFCNGPTASGTSCAKYIILYGNVDYKYHDVSNKW